MKHPRVVLVVGVAAGLLAGFGVAAQSCALHDFEVARPDAAGDVSIHPPRDAGTDSSKQPVHDTGVKRDGKPKADASADANNDVNADVAANVCTAKVPPAKPTGADRKGTTTYWLAVQSIDLGETDNTPPGYDLDVLCTCFNGQGPTCASPDQHCDYADGIDNAALKLLMDIEATDTEHFGSKPFSQEANAGTWSLLLELSGYDTVPDGGVADDPAVDLAAVVSNGSVTQPPAWNGFDSWSVSSSSLGDGGISSPLYTSKGAYVKNHVLVAPLPAMAMTISGGSKQTITVKLSSGVLTGTLEPLLGGFQITGGIIAARWAEHDIFMALSSYRDGDGLAMCTGTFAFGLVRSSICNGMDILVDKSQPTTTPCDAISMGIGFTALPILAPTEVAPPTPLSPGCPAATDPANTSCTDAGVDSGTHPDAHADAHPDAHPSTDAKAG